MMWVLLFLQPTYNGDRIESERVIEVRRFYGAAAEAECKKHETTERHLCAGPIDPTKRTDGWMQIKPGFSEKNGSGGSMPITPSPQR